VRGVGVGLAEVVLLGLLLFYLFVNARTLVEVGPDARRLHYGAQVRTPDLVQVVVERVECLLLLVHLVGY
jgi:hypothetical protein